MVDFFTRQMDYIYFFYGLSFLMLAAMCYVLWKKQNEKIPWLWLGLFGFTHGITEWLDLASLNVSDTHAFRLVRLIFMAASFLFLTQFGCQNFFIISKKRIEKWIYPSLSFFVICAGFFLGETGVNIFSRYAFGLLGGFLAAVTLFLVSKHINPFNKKWLFGASIFLGVYAFTQGVAAPTHFFPASLVNTKTFFATFGFPIQFVRGFLAALITFMTWLYWYSFFVKEYRFRQYVLRGYSLLFLFLSGLVVLGGWILTCWLGEVEVRENKKDLLNTGIIVSSLIHFQNISLLDGALSDIGKPAFEDLRRQLKMIRDTDKNFRFVCLEGLREGKVFFYADAEPSDSEDYSPPGQVYDEVPSEVAGIFLKGKPIFIGPFSDRWGTWVSAFTPIKDPVTNQVLAVLEIDTDAKIFELKIAQNRLMGILVSIILSLLILSIFTNLYLKEEGAIKFASSEERFRIFFENAPEAVFILDSATAKILEVNFLMTRWLGFSREKLLKMTWPDLFEGHLPDGRLETETAFTQEDILKRKAGLSGLNVELTGVGLKFRGTDSILIFMRDITERKRAEAELRKLSQAVEQSPSSVVVTDTLGNIQYVNSKFTQVTGYSLSEVIGRNPRVLKSGETPAETYKDLWGTITSGSEWHGLFHNRKKDGTLFWEIASISPMRDENGKITNFLAIKEDITRRKEMEDELDAAHIDLIKREQAARQMLTELEKANEELKTTQNQLLNSEKLAAIGRLSAGIAHEIKNPLAVILLSVERLESERSHLDDQNKEFVRMIKNAGERANVVISQLLNFSRQSEMKIGNVDLHGTIDEIITITQNLAKVKSIEIKKEYFRGPILLQADKTMIEQVLINLLTNAIDAIQKNGLIQIKTYLRQEAKKKKESEAVIEISDDGCGMSDEVKARIFEPFYTTKEQGRGTGLGLSIVYGILEKHGGEIFVDSQLGVGTKFTVILPCPQKS